MNCEIRFTRDNDNKYWKFRFLLEFSEINLEIGNYKPYFDNNIIYMLPSIKKKKKTVNRIRHHCYVHIAVFPRYTFDLTFFFVIILSCISDARIILPELIYCLLPYPISDILKYKYFFAAIIPPIYNKFVDFAEDCFSVNF